MNPGAASCDVRNKIYFAFPLCESIPALCKIYLTRIEWCIYERLAPLFDLGNVFKCMRHGVVITFYYSLCTSYSLLFIFVLHLIYPAKLFNVRAVLLLMVTAGFGPCWPIFITNLVVIAGYTFPFFSHRRRYL